MNKKNLWAVYSSKEIKQLDKINETYKDMLNKGKTERECVFLTIDLAKKAGYKNLDDIIKNKESLKPNDKVYATCMDKSIILIHIGKDNIEQGMNILGAHIDSPRIDIKQNPLYEDSELVYLDTHYYGGIKKYQWVTIPLALHGVVIKKDGTKININIGEDEEDPVFVITDLLVHLSGSQLEKKARTVIEGENLDILIGNKALKEEEKDAVKKNILNILKENYNIEEEDFLSAELEIVPAGKAKDCGLDKSMILSYGQDDRACAFTSLMAILEIENPKKTSVCVLVDKEEVGSFGATGMHSKFFENTIAEVLEKMGEYSELKLRRALKNSKMLSSDVNAAFDPLYASFFEKKNTAFFAKGLVFSKFTGSRGKVASNDANAEYIANLRKVMDDNNIAYQTAELGKVDIGGGGTIAYILANYGMQVIDSGVAVLSMHAPFELTSKADIYEAYKGYKAFLECM